MLYVEPPSLSCACCIRSVLVVLLYLCMLSTEAQTSVLVLSYAAGLFLSSQVSQLEGTAAMQRIAAPEQDASSLESAVQSASAASDIFMLGCVTYEALVGQPAFPGKSDALSRGGKWQVPYSHHHHTILASSVCFCGYLWISLSDFRFWLILKS